MKTASIIIIGNEILSGRTLDTNSNYLAKMLAERGISLKEVRVIPDVHGIIKGVVNNESSYLDTWLTIKNSRNSSDKWCRYTGSGEFYQYQGKNCNNPVSTRTKRIEEKKALIRERKKKKKVRICQSTFGGIKCKYVWR